MWQSSGRSQTFALACGHARVWGGFWQPPSEWCFPFGVGEAAMLMCGSIAVGFFGALCWCWFYLQGSFVRALNKFHGAKFGTSLRESDYFSYHFSDVWGCSDEEVSIWACLATFLCAVRYNLDLCSRDGYLRHPTRSSESCSRECLVCCVYWARGSQASARVSAFFESEEFKAIT
jgi:hypothetical protein